MSYITVKTYQMLHIFYCICFCIHIRFRKFFTELKAPTRTQSFFKISSGFQHYSWAAKLKGLLTTWISHKTIYPMRTMISCGVYIFYPIRYNNMNQKSMTKHLYYIWLKSTFCPKIVQPFLICLLILALRFGERNCL